ncbi:hypothetical protein GCM10009722_41050 [Williamsia deligens]|nr:hypothetical protein [Williamsia deligens]
MTTPQYPQGTDPALLPQGVLSPDDLGSALQDHTQDKYRQLAAGRFPGIAQSTSAGSPASVSGPLGFVINLYSNLASRVALADPATVTKPDDIVGKAGGFFSGLPLVSWLEDLYKMLTGNSNGLTGLAATIAGLVGIRWGQVDSHATQIADLQDKTQTLLNVIGYGCSYMNDTVDWDIRTAGAKKKMIFATQVGPIVGCSISNGGYTLNSKGLWRIDLQMTFANIVLVSGAIDMDIRVYKPNGDLFAQKFYHDESSAWVSRTNIFSVVVPDAGYRVEAWAGAAFGRKIVGGQPSCGLNVIKISGETA